MSINEAVKPGQKEHLPSPKMSLAEFKAGDPDAYGRVLPYLRRIVAGFVGHDAAEDIVQTAVGNLIVRFAEGYEPNKPDDIVPFMKVVVFNVAKDYARREKRGGERVNDLGRRGGIPQVVPSFEDRVVETVTVRNAWAGIVMTDSQRELLSLQLQGLTVGEIADNLRVTNNTACQRLLRVRTKINSAFGD